MLEALATEAHSIAFGGNMLSALLLLAANPLPPVTRPTVTLASQSDAKRRGDELVRQDMTKRFAAWVVKVPGAIWGAAVSGQARQRYADTQTNASAALLAYEHAGDFYASKKAFVVAATECRIRTKEWAWSIDEKLNKAANQDATLQATRKALSASELDTGDAYAVFMTYFYLGNVVGKDRAKGCRDLAAMPFMATLDRYKAGQIAKLPRL